MAPAVTAAPSAKRPYTPPVLVMHGDVQTITQAAGILAPGGASRLSDPEN